MTSIQVAALGTSAVAALTTDQIAALETRDIAALRTTQVVALTTAQTAALTTDQIVALTTAQVAALGTSAIAALGTDQIAALETRDIAALRTSQLAALTTDQIAAMSTSGLAVLSTAGIGALTTAQAAALTTSQVIALTSLQVAALSTSAVAALTTDQIAQLETTDVAALRTTQIAALTTAQAEALTTQQVVALTTAQIAALSTDAVAALTTDQISALETRDIAALRTSQIAALTTDQVAALTTAGVAVLSTAAMGALSTSQIAALGTDAVVALTTAQVSALSTSAIAALGTEQIAAMETRDLVAMRTTQLIAITTSQVEALTTSQVAALSTTQVEALTTTQIAAFTTDQIGHLALGSPIVLDLDGDGQFSRSVSDGVSFDLFAQGQAVNTGWVSRGDGLLVLDRNGDGIIQDGSELFGTATRLSGGLQALDGYQALSEHDSNGDGRISKDDSVWSSLRVWVDSGNLGTTDAGELKSLEELGVLSLSLDANRTLSKDNGNLVGITSSYETVDGQTRGMADVWFVADADQGIAPTATAAAAPDSLAVAQLVEASQPPVLGDPVTPVDTQQVPTLMDEMPAMSQAAALDPLAPTDLRAKVSSMAAAIGEHTALADGGDSGSFTSSLSASEPALASSGPAVSAMVDVMSQFDAHGNALLGNAPSAAPPSLPNGQDKSKDWLTNGLLGS